MDLKDESIVNISLANSEDFGDKSHITFLKNICRKIDKIIFNIIFSSVNTMMLWPAISLKINFYWNMSISFN